MVFQELIGQERVKRILNGIYTTGNVANGYIFAGPEQCGKTTAAKEFITILNCTGSTPPCGTCPSCQKIKEGKNVDFYQLTVENSVKIEQIRELKKYVQYGAYESKYLAVIIPQTEKMTIEAANSFLKLLEEPPSGVFFILETSNLNQLPKTIFSRCQVINFNQLNNESLSMILNRKYQLAQPTLDQAIKLSGGLLTLAELYLQDQTKIIDLVNSFNNIKQKSFNEITRLADTLSSKKDFAKEDLLKYLSLVGQHFRNTLQLPHARLILDYLKLFQKNINVKLALTALLLNLQEV